MHTHTTMPAGTYYVGDLCYVMHPEWDEFCRLTIDGPNLLNGEFNLSDGRRFATYSTSYGDGTYPASNGAALGVDAGLIGCIRIEDISKDLSLEELNELGTVVTFEKPFKTGNNRGVIYFGDLKVDTSCEDDYWVE